METQTGILEKSVVATQKNAEAADISAKAAMGVAVPTMMLTSFSFAAPVDGSIDAKVFFTRPGVLIKAKNFGQTPAFLKGYSIAFTCNELPDEPVYPYPYTCDSEDVIDIGKTFTPNFDTTTLISPMPDADIDALVARDKRLTVYGYISYGDVFGSPIRYMKFCKRLVEFEFNTDVITAKGYLSNTIVLDCGSYKYTGQHENYDGPGQQQTPKAN
jgi:hypothetical protein